MKNNSLEKILADHKVWLSSKGARGKRANFSKSYLKNLEFNDLNLTKATFWKCSLVNVTFRNCNLQNCNLKQSKFKNVILENVNLKNANIEGSSYLKAF